MNQGVPEMTRGKPGWVGQVEHGLICHTDGIRHRD